MLWTLPLLTVRSHLNGSLPSGVMVHFFQEPLMAGQRADSDAQKPNKDRQDRFSETFKGLDSTFSAQNLF